ncbi:hypothetical protein [Massilia sp. H6]|uniref:hypothetical protein n=1 Tax=Massilia sp. H6 TaxID=2970464 RepID=UPI00216A99F3|nr:hypothetical protein [Massilia sp. H6]UVW29024.1 hypothetical protein NRS07_02460 [Massilia sp. H6]
MKMQIGNVLGALVLLCAATSVSFAADGITANVTSSSCGEATMNASRVNLALARGRCAVEAGTGNNLPDAGSRQFGEEFGPGDGPAFHDETLVASEDKTTRSKRQTDAIIAGKGDQEFASGAYGAFRRMDKYSKFGAAFSEARVPNCLHKDGLKRQPPKIGFFFFQGVLALPFVALAKVRGKCS